MPRDPLGFPFTPSRKRRRRFDTPGIALLADARTAHTPAIVLPPGGISPRLRRRGGHLRARYGEITAPRAANDSGISV